MTTQVQIETKILILETKFEPDGRSVFVSDEALVLPAFSAAEFSFDDSSILRRLKYRGSTYQHLKHRR